MIVLRQLCRNRNTISTVRSAALDDRLLDAVDGSLDLRRRSSTSTRSSTSAGRRVLQRRRRPPCTSRPVSTMFASCAFWMSSVIAGRPLMRAIDVSSFSPSMTSATCDR